MTAYCSSFIEINILRMLISKQIKIFDSFLVSINIFFVYFEESRNKQTSILAKLKKEQNYNFLANIIIYLFN